MEGPLYLTEESKKKKWNSSKKNRTLGARDFHARFPVSVKY